MQGNMVYFLCYDTPVGRRPDGTVVRRVGKQKLDFDSRNLDMNISVCRQMNFSYGVGTHWIEDETGKVVFKD